jgi:hypothetical protein
MNKPQVKKAEEPKGYIGEATPEQIAAWKEAHNTNELLAIKVKNKDGSTSICYLKKADRNVSSLAYTHIANKRMIEAGGVFIANCWLGGDERIKTVDSLYLAACQQAYDALDIAEAESEKI